LKLQIALSNTITQRSITILTTVNSSHPPPHFSELTISEHLSTIPTAS
jgi:hypothetical protein